MTSYSHWKYIEQCTVCLPLVDTYCEGLLTAPHSTGVDFQHPKCASIGRSVPRCPEQKADLDRSVAVSLIEAPTILTEAGRRHA
jgi:hypothetical protein